MSPNLVDWLQPLLAACALVALAACIGCTAVHDALPPTVQARLSRLERLSVWLLGASLTAMWLAATQAMTAAPLADLPTSLVLVLTQTTVGHTAWVALGAWLLLAVAVQLRGPMPNRSITLRRLALLALGYAIAVAGHAADQGLVSRAAWVNTVHVLSACAWAGSVGVCAVLLPSWRHWSPAERGTLAHRLSTVATLAVPLVAATGIANGVRMLGPASHAADSPYFTLLMTKVALVAVAVALGLGNRWVWMKRLDAGQAAGAASFGRVLALEAADLIAVLVLAVKLGATMAPE